MPARRRRYNSLHPGRYEARSLSFGQGLIQVQEYVCDNDPGGKPCNVGVLGRLHTASEGYVFRRLGVAVEMFEFLIKELDQALQFLFIRAPGRAQTKGVDHGAFRVARRLPKDTPCHCSKIGLSQEARRWPIQTV